MKYQLCKDVMNITAKRNAFNELAYKTFNISFENWYQGGYWTKANIPYTLFDAQKAISNVSVNIMEVVWQGHIRHYIQIGTVMTAVEYQNQGLSRFIMNEVLKDWENQCDALFLFANKTVLDYYPKIGFEKELQYQYSMVVEKTNVMAKKLNMNNPREREFLKNYYFKTNPFSKLQVINNYGLLMFGCCTFAKDNIYYSEENDAVIIAEQSDGKLICFDIFCDAGKDLKNIISSVATNKINIAIFKFTPNENLCTKVVPLLDENDTLFLLKGKENIFASQKLMFPEISHT